MPPKRRKVVVSKTSTPPSPPSTPPRSTPSPSPTISPSRAVDPLSPLSPISPWPPPLLPDSSHGTPSTAAGIQRSDVLPSAKEIYGSLAVLLTALGYLVYLAWGFLPSEYLDAIGWTWYPSREWAVIVPCYLMLIVLLTYLIYAALTAFIMPPFDSISLITDSQSGIPHPDAMSEKYYLNLSRDNIMPPAVDLPIDIVNRVLYPPRRRNR